MTGRGSFRDSFAADQPEFDLASLDPGAWERLERLAQASPLYAQLVRRRPALCAWLEEPRNLHAPYRHQALLDEWRAFPSEPGDAAGDDGRVARLRRWRRVMSLRIAYRSVNGLAREAETVDELSLLADFCVNECAWIALRRWRARMGEPWDEAVGRPARFCVLGLGKLGGRELNFSSDIDLLYCYEGAGACRREGRATAWTNGECYTKVAETITTLLNAQTGDGFLFRVDVRLRPEGAWGPLVQPLASLEGYYATAGQTWERLALIKARPVAGDLTLGGELLEDLHLFRYPRRPPPSLLAEVAAMKLRTEQEIVGASALGRDIKRGPGGIREIEFVVQSLQVLHAGRNPFLQTGSTAAALESLARYDLIPREEALFLTEAYWHLRKLEHRLQMRDESQTHELPADAAELASVARSLGFASAEAFLTDLEPRRRRVHAIFSGLFADREVDRAFEDWWRFFTTEETPAPIEKRLRRWFGPDPRAAEALRLFVCGDHRFQITRELVTRFQHLASNFDGLTPELARPLETLSRLARCAERYGTRQQFLNACAGNPHLLRVLALLCDRSTYAVGLLCAHPEILEEVLRPEMLQRRKRPADLATELAAGPAGPEAAAWLWMYVRAEQVRTLIGELLGFMDERATELAMSELADAVIAHLVKDRPLLVVALGKYGGRELTFGSDLDLLMIAEEGAEAPAAAATAELRRILHHGGPLGPTFAVDLRLRPHGEDGPGVATLESLGNYYGRPEAEGGAQAWERQVLTRSRIIAGPGRLAGAFRAWTDGILYGRPPSGPDERAMWAMRRRIERERDVVLPPERAFKTGAGGLIDIEFLAQTFQLRHGEGNPFLRDSATRQVLVAALAGGHLPTRAAEALLEHFGFLKRIEYALRRDAASGVTVIGGEAADQELLARWLGFSGREAFWGEHTRRLAGTRAIVAELVGPVARAALEGREG